MLSTNSRREILLISPLGDNPILILCRAAALHDFQERSASQFVDAKPGSGRFVFRERAAIHATQQEIEQPLPGCRIELMEELA